MSKSSKKPLLVAGGCSLTNANFESRFHPDLNVSWPKWPAIFGIEHGYEVLNTAESGAGNKFIFHSVVNAVNENPDTELVLVLWSAWDRLQIYRKRICPISSVSSRKVREWGYYKDTVSHKVSKLILDSFFDIGFVLNDNILYMWLLKDFLEKRNIKYIFAQGIDPLPNLKYFRNHEKFTPDYFDKKLYDAMETFPDHIYFDDLDVPNVYGWPFFKALGGKQIWDQPGEDIQISRIDQHPNAEGQEMLFAAFSKFYKKIYA